MVSVRVRTAAALLVAGTALAAVGCASAADFIGVSAGGGTSDVVAVYSSSGGHLIRTPTQPGPGGGPSAPRLSPDGQTVIFTRGQGSCAQTIDTVPFRGGREQVLIPTQGSGNNAVIPGDPSYRADGRYLIYATVSCAPGGPDLVHVRDLATGREQTMTGSLGGAGAIFLDHDTEVVFNQNATGTGGTGLKVLQLPSMTAKTYPAPGSCRYQALAGTGTALDALLQCGSGHQLSVVALSPSSFTVTATLALLGVCLNGQALSLASGDPSLMLAETYGTCLRPGASGQDASSPATSLGTIVVIRGGQVWRFVSGPQAPQSATW